MSVAASCHQCPCSLVPTTPLLRQLFLLEVQLKRSRKMMATESSFICYFNPLSIEELSRKKSRRNFVFFFPIFLTGQILCNNSEVVKIPFKSC